MISLAFYSTVYLPTFIKSVGTKRLEAENYEQRRWTDELFPNNRNRGHYQPNNLSTCSKQEFNHKFIHLSLVCLVIVYVLELQWHRLHPDNPSVITLWLTKVAVLGKYLKATILGTCDAAVLACFNPPHSPLFTSSSPAMQIS